MLFHVDIKGNIKSRPRHSMKDYRALGTAGSGSGVQVFFSIPSFKGKIFEKANQIQCINAWLQKWYCSWRDRFLDHWIILEKPHLLGSDGVHLSEERNSVFSYRLAKIVKRA